MIISILDKAAGFYSVLFFMLNHFLYCKKKDITFKLDSTYWLYKSVNGWTDYFKDIDFEGTNEEGGIKIIKHNKLLDNFSMHEYKNAVYNDVYVYNEEVKQKVNDKKTELQLVKGEYDAIYIRHGDKLFAETMYIPPHKYLELLIEKNPDCKTVFLQTDDYNCFLDLEEYIKTHNMAITLLTICDPLTKGIVVHSEPIPSELENCIIKGDPEHKEYFNKVLDGLQTATPLEEMTSEQIYDHTTQLLIGVDIVLNSNVCILNKQSNVARFISIAHNDQQKLFDVRYPSENIDMNWTMCPAYW